MSDSFGGVKLITIYKYPLKVVDKQYVEMPRGGRVFHVANQSGIPHIWAEVDTCQPAVQKVVYMLPTGSDMTDLPDTIKYGGTVHLYNGTLVYHIYVLGC